MDKVKLLRRIQDALAFFEQNPAALPDEHFYTPKVDVDRIVFTEIHSEGMAQVETKWSLTIEKLE